MITEISSGKATIEFQNPVDAERALTTMQFDRMMSKQIQIMRFDSDPSLRNSGVGNVFITNLDKSVDNKCLYQTFRSYGNICSCKVATDENNNKKHYGYIQFDEEESANNAIKNANGMILNSKKMNLQKFIPQAERKKAKEITGTNLYIKNLEDCIDDERLRSEFSCYGNITSAKVMMQNGRSKGYGFVNFSTPEEAARAITGMHGTILESKRLYVNLSQKKEERKAKNVAAFNNYKQKLAAMGEEISQINQTPPTQNHLNMVPIETQPPPNQQICMQIMQAQPIFTNFQPATPMNTTSAHWFTAAQEMLPGVQPQTFAGMQDYRTASPHNVGVAYQPIQPPNMAPGLDHEEEQKLMLGGRLYSLVKDYQPHLCEKITRLLLSLNVSELQQLLEDQSSLKRKVDEAIAALRTYG